MGYLRQRMAGSAVVAAMMLVGGMGLRLLHSQSVPSVGYTIVEADTGLSTPVGAALFSYSNASGVLVSQAGVGAAPAIRSGRILVDEMGTRTAIALVNVSLQPATATLILRDSNGNEVKRTSKIFGARQHLAQYIGEMFGLAQANLGSLSFESDQPLAALTLREGRNGYGEPVYATLPVVDMAAPATADPFTFPQIAVGAGYTTQILLINRSNQSVSGQIRLTASDGGPLLARLSGASVSAVAYQIAPNGIFKGELEGIAGLSAGYAVVTPDGGTPAPSGAIVFRYQSNGQLVSEAGVSASPLTTGARIFVDQVGTRTGVAIANPGPQTANVTLSLMDRGGNIESAITETLAPATHLAKFVDELFANVGDGFTGLMQIRSDVAIAPVTLRLAVNSRNDLVLTTLPVADLTRTSTISPAVFPQIAIGSGFSTRFIFINSDTANNSTGALKFFTGDGMAWTLPLGGQTASLFSYQVMAGSGRQYLPGNAAQAAAIQVIDRATNAPTPEVIINEGNTVRPRIRMIDDAGMIRDDFDLAIASIDSGIAAVNSDGSITGKHAGFATLTMTAGRTVVTNTATVVHLELGSAGFAVTGVVQDLSQRLYLAATDDDTILLAQDVRQPPQVYSGIRQTPGLKNDLRLQSQFKNPSFLALNQADGSLYVSDTANHVIRTVRPGTTGRVETLAGTGQAGSRDGAFGDAMFNNPQGIALDDRGNIWVVDSGNHTIRRINLVTRRVETVAGKPGVSGFADGTGDEARFSSPVGIALELETAAQQLERQIRGDPPPPLHVIVADTGNGAIRRVQENGQVETLGAAGVLSRPSLRRLHSLSGIEAVSSKVLPLINAPAAVAADLSGSVYFTEAGGSQTKVILPAGNVVAATELNTFRAPKGLAVTASGKVVVADSGRPVKEISFGGPQVTSITPSHVSDRGGALITITGKNFSPDTRVVIAGKRIGDAQIINTQTISASVPALPSGNGTVTIQNRGGVAQAALLIDAVPLSQLSPGQITTVAGGTTYFGDGGPAAAGTLADPDDIAVDSFGNLIIADTVNHRIRKVHAVTGIITTVAGTGFQGFSGDGDSALLAQLSQPHAVAVDALGNLLIADTGNNRIRKVDAASGKITTIAGGLVSGYSGDSGPAAAALLNNPSGIALDAAGNIFIGDSSNHRVRKIDGSTGIITTVAGVGTPGYSGDGGPATQAQLGRPEGLAIDKNSNLYIADSVDNVIRMVDLTKGVIQTVAGTGQPGFGGDAGPAIAARLSNPRKIALDPDGNLLIADQLNGRIRKFSSSDGTITTVAGIGGLGFSGDDGPAIAAQFTYPGGVATGASGNLFIVDTYNDRIREVSAKTSIIKTIVGIGRTAAFGDSGPATAATLEWPQGLALDAAGNLLIADSYHNRIRKLDAVTGTISTVAGSGQKGFLDGPASSAQFKVTTGVAVDGAGNILIVDSLNAAIRKLTIATGIVSTVAGGSWGSGGDNGPAAQAQFKNLSRMAIDANGNYFVADSDNNKVRKIDAQTSIVTTFAGTGEAGYSGDNVVASIAKLYGPYGVALDGSGNLYIADLYNSRIRKVSAATQIITTVAGSGVPGYAGDNQLATAAQIYAGGVLVDFAGNIFIADTWSHRVRRVDAVTGIITTIAGTTGKPGFSGDGGLATAAQLREPADLALASDGTLYITDRANFRIRAIRGPIR